MRLKKARTLPEEAYSEVAKPMPAKRLANSCVYDTERLQEEEEEEEIESE